LTKHLTLAAAAAFLFATATSAGAAPCRDAHGKYVKCPPAHAAVTKCRDKTSKKFVKCGVPNSEPVPAAAPTHH